MTFIDEFVLLFSEMGIIPAICLIAGIILVIVEIFQPGFGFFGILGGVLIIVGIAVRVADSGSGNPVTQFFLLMTLTVLILIIAFACMVHSAKKGWLSRTAIIENGSAVSEDYTQGTKDFRELIGKKGITVCKLRPSGSVSFDGKIYDVVSNSSFVEKDKVVVVLQVEGIRIVVEEVKAISIESTQNTIVQENNITEQE